MNILKSIKLPKVEDLKSTVNNFQNITNDLFDVHNSISMIKNQIITKSVSY